MEPTVELNVSSLFGADVDFSKSDDVVNDRSMDEWVDVEDDCLNLQITSSSDDSDSEQVCPSSGLPIEYVALVPRCQSDNPSVPIGILKRSKKFTHNDNAIVECLSLFTSVPHKAELLCFVRKVFKNLCVDHFFYGDCISSLCRDLHHLNPGFDSALGGHELSTVWNSGLFVMFYADHPDIMILKLLINYFAAKKDRSKTLAFAKCFSKVRISNTSALAQHLVTSLTSFIKERDAVTMVLYLAAPQMDYRQMDSLMQCLGVFHRSLMYSELLQHLNSLSHVMGYIHLLEIIREIMTHSVKDERIICAVNGFLGRLNELDLSKVKMEAIPFFEKFGTRLTESHNLAEESTPPFPKTKKKIKFGKVIIAEFSTQPELVDEEVPPSPPMIDAPQATGGNGLQAYEMEARYEKRVNSVLEVFKNVCCNHLLSGQCSDPTCHHYHKLEDFTLKHVNLEKAKYAADFYVDMSTSPSLTILKVFLDYFIEHGDSSQVLSFARCSAKLPLPESSVLSAWVLSALVHSKNSSYLMALEKLLAPEIPLGIESESSPAFYFDSALLRTIIDEVVETCSYLPQMITHQINRRIENLPQEEARRMATSIENFFEQFVTPAVQGSKLHVSDVLPVDSVAITDFRTQLCASLRNGSTNKYFAGTMMLKLAVDHDWRDLAADVLYEFLLNRPCRHIVDDMLENCSFICPEPVRFSTKLIICNVAISCCLRSYESGDMGEAVAVFNVLRHHRISLQDLEPYLHSVSRPTLALVCYNLFMFESHFSEAVDLFLQDVFVPYLEEIECSPSLKQINETIDKLVNTLFKSNSIDPMLKLFNGIMSRVKEHGPTLGEDLNIVSLSEIVLRCCFVHHSRENVRESCLKLYFDLSSNYKQLNFQKVTQRSLLLTAVNQVDKTCRAAKQLVPNLLSSPMKKLLAHCIKAGAYPKLSTSSQRLELHSTMTFDEIRVYLIWWMFKYLEARKRAGVKYFDDTTVTLIQDCVLDDSQYPVHYSLLSVDNSITGCATRLTAVLKKLVTFPIHPSMMIQKKKLGVYQIPWHTVSALSKPVIQCLNLYNFTNVKNVYLCSSCFDKDDIEVNFDSR